jgi:hypothetical protein
MNALNKFKKASKKILNDTELKITDEELFLQSERDVPGHKKNKVTSSMRAALTATKKTNENGPTFTQSALHNPESKGTVSSTTEKIDVPFDESSKDNKKSVVPSKGQANLNSKITVQGKPIDGEVNIDEGVSDVADPMIEISEVKEKVPDSKKAQTTEEENMVLGSILFNEAIIEIEEENKRQIPNKKPKTETETVNKSDEEIADKQKQRKRMEDLNKVQGEFSKCNEGNTKVTSEKDYVLFAQKVFRSIEVDVVSIDDPFLGKVNVVTKGPINWIDNSEKMSFFSKDLLKSPNDKQSALELATIALCAAQAKGWGKLKITVANAKMAETIKIAAEGLGINDMEIKVKQSPILEKQEAIVKDINSNYEEINADETLSTDEKVKRYKEIEESKDAFVDDFNKGM